jgi:8-oxo-dGTP diphosphatase
VQKLSKYIPSSPEEEKFLADYNPTKYGPGVAYTVDIIVFTIHNGKLSLPLVKRGGFPYKGSWALPGGFVESNESSEEAAVRELGEETGLSIDKIYCEQLKTYSDPDRDPRMRVVSTAYVAFIPHLGMPVGGDDAVDAHLFAVEDILSDDEDITLAFDHLRILEDALERAKSKLEYTPLAATFLEAPFTLSDLRRVYETVWGQSLHAANFRRKVLSTNGFVVPIGEKGSSKFESGRTAELYTIGNVNMLHPALLRNQD